MNDFTPVFVVALPSEGWEVASWRLYKVAPSLWEITLQLNEEPLAYPENKKAIRAILSKEFGGLAIQSISKMLWVSDLEEMLRLFPYCN